MTFLVRPFIVLVAYILLVRIAAKVPDLSHELAVSDDARLPRPKDVFVDRFILSTPDHNPDLEHTG